LDKIPFHKIENFTGASCYAVPKALVIKHNDYFIDDTISVDGDAPKKFIGVYDYRLLNGKHKANHKNWIRYIAKTGHKWYPIESVTELLLNRLGTIFGLKMAESRIAMIGGQLRFLSRYFIDSARQELVHGADVLAGYLNEPSFLFIEEVDKQKLTREWLTLQFVEDAVESVFPEQKEEIMCELIRLIIFDALVGNNDRHFFNWGIVRSVEGGFKPYFSPVYDTARGLFWNYSEEKLAGVIAANKAIDSHITKYCKTSRPKIGWEGEKNLNHFELFNKIYSKEFYVSKAEVRGMLTPLLLERLLEEVTQNFHSFMSVNRITMICKCLIHRFNKLQSLL